MTTIASDRQPAAAVVRPPQRLFSEERIASVLLLILCLALVIGIVLPLWASIIQMLPLGLSVPLLNNSRQRDSAASSWLASRSASMTCHRV